MFDSREQAGKLLVKELKRRHLQADLVLGIPRGGVVVAGILAQALKIPLDVVVVKKLGAPHNPELAIGALAPDGVTLINEQLASAVGADQEYLKQEVLRCHQELLARQKFLRQRRPLPQLKGKRVILTDDGIATGATAKVAIAWLKKHQVAQIVLAVPVASRDTTAQVCPTVDTCVILDTPESFAAVGQFYADFREVSDKEVVKLLKI